MKIHRVVELLGDGISAELSESVHRVAEALGAAVEFMPVDLSLQNRRARGKELYDEAVKLIKEHRVSLKYPTETKGESPNAVLRDACDFAVIHRPVATIPGVENNFKGSIDLDVVRIATGGTYADQGKRLTREVAVSLRIIERRPSLLAARFAFELAQRKGAKTVVSASKYTIQKETDGLFEEAVDEIAASYPWIERRRELFDSLLAGIVMKPERYGVIVCPNEYGDFLSDAACGLIGSIGIGDSSSYAFDDAGNVTCAMFDPAGGTAPDIAGQDKCNPTAALLSLANLLAHIGAGAQGERLRAALRGAIADRASTRDLGGKLSTSQFTEEVVARAR